MAGKLTIRRVGAFFPALCLLVVLLCSISFVWLTLMGFPAALLRKVEKLAAKQGVYLHLGSAKLDPAQGLALRVGGLRYYAEAERKTLLAEAQEVSASVEISHLFSGRISPGCISLRGGSARIPLREEEGKALEMTDIEISGNFRGCDIFDINQGHMRLMGIPISVAGSLRLEDGSQDDESDPSESKPFDLLAELEPYQHYLGEFYRHVKRQNWSRQDSPSVRLRFNNLRKTYVSLRLNLPRLDEGQFHFRNGCLDASLADERIKLNSLSFDTVDPDARVLLRGAYNISKRQGAFELNSSAMLIRMATKFLGEDAPAQLRLLSHPDDCAPTIKLQGDVELDEQYYPEKVYARGSFSQQQLQVGSVQVDQLALSFLYDNGNFNLDQLTASFPEGEISARASANGGNGQAKLNIDMPSELLLRLASELTGQEISLPEGLTLGERINSELRATLTAPLLCPGNREWEDFVPSLRRLNFHLNSDTLKWQNFVCEGAAINLDIDGIEQHKNLMPKKAERISLQCSAQSIQEKAEAAPAADREGEAAKNTDKPLDKSAAGLALEGLQISLVANNLLLPEQGEGGSIGPCKLNLDTRKLHWEDWQSDELELYAEAAAGVNFPQSPIEMLRSMRVELVSKDLLHKETQVQAPQLELSSDAEGLGQLRLQIGDKETGTRLHSSVDWRQAGKLRIQNLQLRLPLQSYADFLDKFNAKPTQIRLPEMLTLEGDLSFDLDKRQLEEGLVKLEIPRLVRTPQLVPALKDKEQSLSLSTEVQLHGEEGGKIFYHADILASHAEGELSGIAEGELSQGLRFRGASSLPVPVINALVDYPDAHWIMRDFLFPERNSKSLISNIDVRVDYSCGVSVDSRCDVQLENVGYQLFAYQDKEDGSEYLRKDLGPQPFSMVKDAHCQVDVNVKVACRDKDGKKVPDEACINIINPYLNYDNKPWQKRQGLKSVAENCSLQGDAVIIDVEHSFVELKNISGCVYPAYSLGMFYDELHGFLGDLKLPQPVQVQTESCVFPIYSDCVRPMSGNIFAKLNGLGYFHFLGTDIPLKDFSGVIHITDKDVTLDRLNALTWGGVANGIVKIGFAGKHTDFDGYIRAQNMDLKQIAQAYGATLSSALCNGNIRFRAASPDLSDIEAYGDISITNGDLMELTIFQPVSDLVADIPGHISAFEESAVRMTGQKPGFFSRVIQRGLKKTGDAISGAGDKIGSTTSKIPLANHFLRYDLQEVYSRFNIVNGHLYSDGMKARGCNLNVGVNLDINLNDLGIRGNLWPKITSVPTLIAAPVTVLSDFMIDIILYGYIDDIRWKFGLDKNLKRHQQAEQNSPQDKEADINARGDKLKKRER